MKKLKLIVEELRVEQFRLQPDVAATGGTVRGLEHSYMSCVSCPCGETDNGGGDSYGCASNGASEPCYYCFPMP